MPTGRNEQFQSALEVVLCGCVLFFCFVQQLRRGGSRRKYRSIHSHCLPALRRTFARMAFILLAGEAAAHTYAQHQEAGVTGSIAAVDEIATILPMTFLSLIGSGIRWRCHLNRHPDLYSARNPRGAIGWVDGTGL